MDFVKELYKGLTKILQRKLHERLGGHLVRINIYSQELTSEVKLISKESDGKVVTGIPCLPNGKPNEQPREALHSFALARWEETHRPPNMMGLTNPYRDIREDPITYHAAQLMLHSSSMLHHPPHDDDRSAVTFWLPKSKVRREEMAKAFERIAEIFRTAPSETGHD